MSRGPSPTSSGANSSLIMQVNAWFCAMPPTCALASPQPVKPHSVSIRTKVPSNDRVRPKSLGCCRSGGIGMCTQDASTDLIFIFATLSAPLEPGLRNVHYGHAPEVVELRQVPPLMGQFLNSERRQRRIRAAVQCIRYRLLDLEETGGFRHHQHQDQQVPRRGCQLLLAASVFLFIS